MSEVLSENQRPEFEHGVEALVIDIDELASYIEAERLKEKQINYKDFMRVSSDSDSDLKQQVVGRIAAFKSVLRNNDLLDAIHDVQEMEDRPKYLRFYWSYDRQEDRKITLFEFNNDFDVFAGASYVGARKSRAPEEFIDIFGQVVGVNSGERLATIFAGYGHASVADMSPVMLYIDGLSMNDAFRLFNYTSVGGGQELSTRYVEFGEQNLRTLRQLGLKDDQIDSNLELEYRELQQTQTAMYQSWLARLKPRIAEFLTDRIGDEQPMLQEGTVNTRSLDVARNWLPMGSRTGMCYMTSVRNWVDIARQLNQSGKPGMDRFADHIVDVLKISDDPAMADVKANLGKLTKYYEGTETIATNLDRVAQLGGFITKINSVELELVEPTQGAATAVSMMRASENRYESTPLMVQYLSVIYPNVHPLTLKDVVNRLDSSEMATLSEAVFADHTQHDQMSRHADVRGTQFVLDTSVGMHRDLNRQRAFSRLHIQLDALNALDALKLGFNIPYGIQNAEYWQQFESEWIADFTEFYEKMFGMIDKLEQRGVEPDTAANVLSEIMPLGQQTRGIYSAGPNQLAYMTSLRIAVGGDYGYRDAVWQMLELIRQDPGYRYMSSHLEKPDINSVEQLMGRS